MKNAEKLKTNLVIHWPKRNIEEIVETFGILTSLMKKNNIKNKVILEIPAVKNNESDKVFATPIRLNLL